MKNDLFGVLLYDFSSVVRESAMTLAKKKMSKRPIN